MSQVLVEVSDEMIEGLERKAEALGKSVSAYLADLVRREVSSGWPPGYFENVIGSIRDESFVRPPQLAYEVREPFD